MPSRPGSGGMAMGVNQAAAMSGSFIGLVLGGVLAPINWRLIFLVSVPVGLLGTVLGYLKLRELSARRPARIDWPGNITFAARPDRWSWSASPTGSSPTVRTPWAGRTRWSSAA